MSSDFTVPLRFDVSVSISGVESPLTVMLSVICPTSSWISKAFACSAMTPTLSRIFFLKPVFSAVTEYQLGGSALKL